MNRYDMVMFDCDGTLVDSLWGIAHVMNVAFEEEGFSAGLTSQAVGQVVGLSLSIAIAHLLPEASPADHERVTASYKAHYKRMADDKELKTVLFPGVRETLDALKEMGVVMTMATGKSMAGVRRNIEELDLDGYFTVLKSADCAISKPHPDMLEQTLAETGLDPARSLMVGDTVHDLHMGRAAGVPICAVTYGCHPLEQLLPAQPDHVIHSLPELIPLLEL